jgi:non-specific serine/threonine protein kinase
VVSSELKASGTWTARGLARICLAATLAVASLNATAAQASGWSSSERLERARSGLAATSVGDLIYVGGGASAGDPANSFDVFDASRESWKPLPSMPAGLVSFAMAGLGTKVFVSGGYSGDDPGQPRTDMWAFDTEMGSWSHKASMPLARAAHAMIAVGGKIYVVGGSGPGDAKVMVYDPASDKWKTGATLAVPRRAVAAATDGKRIFVVGGITKDGSVSAALDAFDPATGTFTSLPPIPSGRGALTAAFMNGQLHVAGGATWKPLKTYANHDVFTVASKSWSKGAALPSARQGMAAGAAAGRFWVFGGGSGAGVFGVFTATDAVDSFEP